MSVVRLSVQCMLNQVLLAAVALRFLECRYLSCQPCHAGLLALRTIAITTTFALGTSLAARSDTAHAAAHQICLQLWLASSLLADSLAVAAQTLLALGIAAKELGQARRVRHACMLAQCRATALTVEHMLHATALIQPIFSIHCIVLPMHNSILHSKKGWHLCAYRLWRGPCS